MNIVLMLALGGVLAAGMQQDLKWEIRDTGPVVQVIVAQEKYCIGQPGVRTTKHEPPDALTLRLRVRLYYRNVTAEPLILPTYHELSALIVSRSTADISDGRNQLIIRFNPRRKPSDELPADIKADVPVYPFFSVIRPGEIFEKYFEDYAVLPVKPAISGAQQFPLLGRKVLLQLELSHSELSPTLAQNLRIKWQPFGHLWTGTVQSKPIEIDIPASPKIGDCSHEYTL
jgi:hypothetical protein